MRSHQETIRLKTVKALKSEFSELPRIRSPLRYPGGKSRAVMHIYRHIRDILEKDRRLCSPFFGGGSLEIFCAQRKIRVYGYDNFKPLVDFWQCLLKDSNLLANEVSKHRLPVGRKKFYRLQQEQLTSNNRLERAAMFFVLNRTSYSGSTLCGGMATGGKYDNPRFTRSSIDRLRNFKIKNLSVKLADFKKSIPKHEDDLLYLDPPYMVESRLYGVKGDLHRDFDHKSLEKILKRRDKWVLSYNNTPEIRERYCDYKIRRPKWTYGMSNDKASREILIFSHDIAKKLE